MKRDDILRIACILTSKIYDYETEMSAFIYELSDKKYEITFKRSKGQFESFTIRKSEEE